MWAGDALLPLAPDGAVTAYDRRHLSLYAALLDADEAGTSWREVSWLLMRLHPDADGTQRCWATHLGRARWIIGEGLSDACHFFGSRPAT